MKTRQKEVVDEIRRMCGEAKPVLSLGWRFKYNGRGYLYFAGNDESMMRFCNPVATVSMAPCKRRLREAADAVNRNVRFIKALLSKDETTVSLNYDYKMTDSESARDIVPHIIRTLDFATEYFKKEMNTN